MGLDMISRKCLMTIYYNVSIMSQSKKGGCEIHFFLQTCGILMQLVKPSLIPYLSRSITGHIHTSIKRYII